MPEYVSTNNSNPALGFVQGAMQGYGFTSGIRRQKAADERQAALDEEAKGDRAEARSDRKYDRDRKRKGHTILEEITNESYGGYPAVAPTALPAAGAGGSADSIPDEGSSFGGTALPGARSTITRLPQSPAAATALPVLGDSALTPQAPAPQSQAALPTPGAPPAPTTQSGFDFARYTRLKSQVGLIGDPDDRAAAKEALNDMAMRAVVANGMTAQAALARGDAQAAAAALNAGWSLTTGQADAGFRAVAGPDGRMQVLDAQGAPFDRYTLAQMVAGVGDMKGALAAIASHADDVEKRKYDQGRDARTDARLDANAADERRHRRVIEEDADLDRSQRALDNMLDARAMEERARLAAGGVGGAGGGGGGLSLSEMKNAGDLYAQFAVTTGDTRFDNSVRGMAMQMIGEARARGEVVDPGKISHAALLAAYTVQGNRGQISGDAREAIDVAVNGGTGGPIPPAILELGEDGRGYVDIGERDANNQPVYYPVPASLVMQAFAMEKARKNQEKARADAKAARERARNRGPGQSERYLERTGLPTGF